MPDPAKLLTALDERPAIWLNVIQSMNDFLTDRLTEPFSELLANALGEHTNRYDDETGDLIESIDLAPNDDIRQTIVTQQIIDYAADHGLDTPDFLAALERCYNGINDTNDWELDIS